MSRALVLGGGGPVGVGWESGLLVGLRGAGVDLGQADFVLGTSAGSIVGAQVTAGTDLAESVRTIAAVGSSGGSVGAPPAGDFVASLAEAVTATTSPEEARIALGRVSVASATIPEELYLHLFDDVADVDWPERFACTAVDVETGELKVWDRGAGVPLRSAVASSCSVPAIYPPVTIGGRRYMDGGMRTALNTDLAAGHDTVIAVSCMALSLPEGMSDPTFDALNRQIEAELAAVTASGSALEVIAPSAEFLDLSGWGLNLMDFGLIEAAYTAGLRQAATETERIAAAWKAA